MKNVFVAVALLMAVPAMAQSIQGDVQDHYRTITKRIPVTQQYCQDVQVPIHGERSNGSTGGVVLGGIVGNALGAATGITDARTLGTVIGMVAGNEMSRQDQVSGYRIEQRCNNVVSYQTESREVYSHSTITFFMNGRTYTATFQK